MGSAVRCRLLEPSRRLLKPGGSATAGSSSPAVLQVPSPRDQPYFCSLLSSPPPETRARAEGEQTSHQGGERETGDSREENNAIQN